MKMSLVVEGLLPDVMAVGELGDELVADVAERIAAVLARSRAEPDPRPVVRGGGRAARASCPRDASRSAWPATTSSSPMSTRRRAVPESDAELSARITLRLSDQLKARVEESASRAGDLRQQLGAPRLSNGARRRPTSAVRPGRLAPRAVTGTQLKEGSQPWRRHSPRGARCSCSSRTRWGWSPSPPVTATGTRVVLEADTPRCRRVRSSAPSSSAGPTGAATTCIVKIPRLHGMKFIRRNGVTVRVGRAAGERRDREPRHRRTGRAQRPHRGGRRQDGERRRHRRRGRGACTPRRPAATSRSGAWAGSSACTAARGIFAASGWTGGRR